MAAPMAARTAITVPMSIVFCVMPRISATAWDQEVLLFLDLEQCVVAVEDLVRSSSPSRYRRFRSTIAS